MLPFASVRYVNFVSFTTVCTFTLALPFNIAFRCASRLREPVYGLEWSGRVRELDDVGELDDDLVIAFVEDECSGTLFPVDRLDALLLLAKPDDRFDTEVSELKTARYAVGIKKNNERISSLSKNKSKIPK